MISKLATGRFKSKGSNDATRVHRLVGGAPQQLGYFLSSLPQFLLENALHDAGADAELLADLEDAI
jgi:hypothetical protein